MSAIDTLGYKQSNPLNMRPMANDVWHGQTGAANGFCVFSDPRWCFRAWLIEAHSYRAMWACKTAYDYIEHYAPPADSNDPVAYATAVEKYMGIPPGSWIDLDKQALPFIKGQMSVEIGGVPYDDAFITEGLSWAVNR